MNKTALITGASGGLGLSFVNIFAKDGYDVVLVARNGARLEEIKTEVEKKYGVNATVIAKDLCSADGAKEVYTETQAKGITVDVLVNNAGLGDFGEFWKNDFSRQERIVDLNCTALIELCHLYLPQMGKNGSGKI